jgi:hypothetical protein
VTPTADFITLLKAHPWGFESLRDAPYDRGLASQRKLLYLCQQQPELFRLYNHAENRFIRSLPFDFQSVPGTLPGKDEKQHTQTHHHPMNPELIRLIRAAALAVVNECDSMSSVAPPTTPPPQSETPAPVVEKPVKTKAAKAAAPAPAPEPEPEQPEAPTITQERLKAAVQTLPDDGKKKLKEYFMKKFGHNTFAEITENHYADIHAAAVKIGAVDTDPADTSDMP